MLSCTVPDLVDSGQGPLHTHLAEARSKEGRHIWFLGHSRFKQGSRTQGPGNIFTLVKY